MMRVVADPPSGGENRNRKIAKKIFGWMAFQALAAWIRQMLEDL
ncbi:hypothetical protein [Streptomyces virginiae]